MKGWLRGPHTPSEVDGLLGTSDWIPVRRFAVVQNFRTGPILSTTCGRTQARPCAARSARIGGPVAPL